MFDAEPVGYTDNRTQIARILHAVESEAELFFQEMFRCPSGRALTEYGQHILRILLQAGFLKLFGRYFLDFTPLTGERFHGFPSRIQPFLSGCEKGTVESR